MTLAALLLLADLEIASVKPVKTTLTTDETFTVAVRVHNRGPEEAKDVKVLVGANALSLLKSLAAPRGWTCEQGPVFGYALACTTPSLPADGDAELTMTMASSQHQAMTYRVSARVQTASKDEDETNDRREQAMVIEATKSNADLSLKATAEANQVNIEIRNAGPHDAREVLVVLDEANDLAFKASGRGWTCTGTTCTRPLLKAGATASLKVSTAAPPAGTTATISARVRAEQNREYGKDNEARVALPPTSE